jgi:thiazole synthase
MDDLIIGRDKVSSRLFLGSGKYPDDRQIPEILYAAGADVITVAVRRFDPDSPTDNMLQHIPDNIRLMPNTSGARTAEEAVRIARIAQAAGCGDWVKIEVIDDNNYLLPDGYETAAATEILAREGFIVLPYINPDLYVARSLRDAGAAAVMPLAAPIGTNRGLRTEEMIRILIDEINLPLIVDAGIGTPSDACRAMEMGAAACLVNTAIASSGQPILMAEAFKQAVEAGRKAFLAGRGAVSSTAVASSPLTGFLHESI